MGNGDSTVSLSLDEAEGVREIIKKYLEQLEKPNDDILENNVHSLLLRTTSSLMDEDDSNQQEVYSMVSAFEAIPQTRRRATTMAHPLRTRRRR